METFTATFFSHYAAMCFAREAKEQGIEVRLRPVPRALSSSCGTCATWMGSKWDLGLHDDVEGIWRKEGARWVNLWPQSQ